jgi:Phosphoribosyl transferase domain
VGIDVSDNKIVTYNPNHQQRVVTSLSGAHRADLGDVTVSSIFARRKSKRDERDGNPLIYALKDKFGYSIPYESVRHLYNCASANLPLCLANGAYCVVVPLPSSSKLTYILSQRMARRQSDCPMISCLDKTTIGQVLAMAPQPQLVEKRYRKKFISQINTLQKMEPNSVFEMKAVEMALRPYFTPLMPNSCIGNIAGMDVLLVDDILGSGTSILSATKILLAAGARSVSAVTLMGSLDGH